MIQWETEAGDSHQTPPPDFSKIVLPVFRVAPPRTVNPRNPAPLASETVRIAPGPFVVTGSQAPSMMVCSGPPMPHKVTGRINATRLVKSPATTRPPRAYTPLAASTNAPEAAASTASCNDVAAVAQLV